MGERNLRLPLFIMRLSVFYFLFPWVLIRFVKPDTAQGIAKKHYYIENFPQVLNLGLGVFGVVSLLAFLVGFKKRFSYAAVFLIHAVGTVLVIPKMIPFIDGFRAVFLAAIPTLALMWLLYYLREEDTLFTVDNNK